jgi:RNA polymerase sigma-70 factor (family 1)
VSAGDSAQRRSPLRRDIPEAEWPARIRAGDERAFEAMFRAYYDVLYRYVVVILGSREAAEDVVQAVFVRIWQERETWEVRGPLRHYLLVAARCGAISALRRDAVRTRAASLLTREALTTWGAPAAEVELEAEELRCRLERALASLPPRAREAFVLSRDEGLSHEEVALRMGISPRTVGVHIGKALAVLRKAILLLAATGGFELV